MVLGKVRRSNIQYQEQDWSETNSRIDEGDR